MKENYNNYILYALLILVIIALVFAFTGFSPKISIKTTKINNQVADKSSFKSIDSGSTGPGDVSIELTPLEVSNGQLQVEIAANTHSVDLGQFDLKKITTLEYNGKSIKPISVPNLGSHHSGGAIIFDIDQKIDSFTIKIRGIPKLEERVFAWP